MIASLAYLRAGGGESERKEKGLTVPTERRGGWKPPWRWLPLGIVPLLLWLAFRQVDLDGLVEALSHLTSARLLTLAGVNVFALLSLSVRWWLILRALGSTVAFPVLSLYRLVGFGWSYFTPGPQFGGEPWQVHLLTARGGVRGTEAIASVGLEKSVELVANFSFLVFGLAVVLRLGLFPGNSLWPLLFGALLLLAAPIALLLFARHGHLPVGWLMEKLPSSLRAWPPMEGLLHLVGEAENLGVQFLQRDLRTLVITVLASYSTWGVLVGEYWLMARFLGLDLTLWTAIAVLTAARVAYLLPMPGGLGTLEASQVLALGALGYPLEAGAALALLIRGRDILFGGIGLIAGGLLAPGRRRGEI